MEKIKYLAKLARLELNEKDIKKFEKQIPKILDFVGQLEKINTENIQPTARIIDLKSIVRKDNPQISNKQEKLLNEAPKRQDNFIKTKGVFENYGI